MKITYIARSFLDYRIPVYKALDDLCGHELTVIYNGDLVPKRCQDKLTSLLGDRAVALTGEKKLTTRKRNGDSMANSNFSIPLQKGLVNAVRRSRPKVMISDGFFQWTYAPLIIRALGGGVKHVMCYERTFHTERNAGKLRSWYRRWVSRWIDGIDCNGSLTAEYVTKGLRLKKPLAFGHMTAETEGIASRVDECPSEESDRVRRKYNLQGTVFLYLGKLTQRKGVMEMLEAWKQAKLDGASLLLVGEGEQRGLIETFLRDNHLKNVALAGQVNYDHLAPYMKTADIFIIPTLEDNWSLVVPEAMAAGLPIACSIYNGCHPELVQKRNGWTFNPLDIDSMATTLQDILLHRNELKQMGTESRRIIANHTPEHAAQALYGLCENVLRNTN